jgi:hypothetical protein
MPKGEGGGQILNLQNTFDKVCDVSRMEIHTENFFGSPIHSIMMVPTLEGGVDTQASQGQGSVTQTCASSKYRTRL